MPLIWEQTFGDDHYAVRTAGASVRLYRNGVHHSQWNPDRPFAGSIWDLLSLPADWIPTPPPPRALILGLGAGTVARQIERAFGITAITGIDLDPVHLSIATGFFDLPPERELIEGDAVEWIETQEREWDFIVDDLYGEGAERDPIRNAPSSPGWFRTLEARLSDRGILVYNELEPGSIENHPILRVPDLRAAFPAAGCLRIDGYENRVLVFSRGEIESCAFTTSLDRIITRFPSCRKIRGRFHWERF